MDTTTGGADDDDAYRENRGPDRSRYASEVSSSLPLQILIYYNGLLSVVYFILEGALVVEKVIKDPCGHAFGLVCVMQV